MKKHFSLATMIFVLAVLTTAQAFAKKLNLESLQGKYEYVTSKSQQQPIDLSCPATINIVFNSSEASLVAYDLDYKETPIYFSFSHIGLGKTPLNGGLTTDAQHAAYSDQWIETRVTSDSLVETKADHYVTTNTINLPPPQVREPLDETASQGSRRLLEQQSQKNQIQIRNPKIHRNRFARLFI